MIIYCSPQGSFSSTSENTQPSEERVEIAEKESTRTTTTEVLPHVEGPLIRKWEADIGGIRRTRGRGWISVYMTLMEGKLTFYKDRRIRCDQVNETLHGEVPLELDGAVAVPALDYTKRHFVFRLRLSSGAVYLFQAVSAEVLQRWVEAINETVSKLTPRNFKRINERAHSLPESARQSRRSSVASTQEKQSLKRRHSSLHRILKRP